MIAAWTLYLQNMYVEPVSIIFDVTNDASPVIIGLDVKKHITTDVPLKARLRLLVVPARLSLAMLGEARKPHGIRPITLANRIHGMTHIHPNEAIGICEDAGWIIPELRRAI